VTLQKLLPPRHIFLSEHVFGKATRVKNAFYLKTPHLLSHFERILVMRILSVKGFKKMFYFLFLLFLLTYRVKKV